MIKTRFAPSPTGFMHIGNLRTCLYGFLFAKKNKGKYILRIEDTDQEREVKGAVESIYTTLNKAGIYFDEGPKEGGDSGPYIQSERKEIYQKYAQQLLKNNTAYYCFCTKEKINEMKDEKGIAKYNKNCLHLSEKEIEDNLKNNISYVIRQNVPVEGSSTYEDLVFGKITIPNGDIEDNILIKSDGMPTYNFANVIDDHLMGVTHVMRGMEYLTSTPKYNMLYDSFGWDRPTYIHMPPIMRDERHKLSKRHGDANFEDFIEKGYLPEAIINYIALLGWSPGDNTEKMSIDEMIQKFSVDNLQKSGSIFDVCKLDWLNGEYIKNLTDEQFYADSLLFFEKSEVSKKYGYEKIAPILKNRIHKYSEIPSKIEFLINFKIFDQNFYDHKKLKITKCIAYDVIVKTREIFKKIDMWQESIMKEELEKLINESSLKKGQVYLPIRLALTGYQMTAGGATEIANILGKDETLKRLDKSIKWLGDYINEKES